MKEIRNRDIPILRSVIAAMAEITSIENRMIIIRGKMINITTHLSWTHGGGQPTGLDESFAELAEIEELHVKAVKRYTRQTKRAERILNGIQNTNMRAFVRMMYVDGRPGTEVADALCMTRRGFENAREAVEQAENMEAVEWTDRYAEKK